MALSGWSCKSLITVAANKLTSTVANQVVFFTAAHFNPGMLTLGGAYACKTDGSDLRFSTDSDGSYLIPFNVIRISLNADPSLSEIVVAVKFSTVTANESFSFYCHWANPSADMPAMSSLIGSGECWSQFYGMLPLQEDPELYTTTSTMWKCFKDVTGKYSAGSKVSLPVQVDGPIPGMKAMSVGSIGGFQIPETAATNRGGFQIAMICKISAFTGFYFSQSQSATDGFAFDAGIAKVQYSGNWSYNFSSLTNQWGILRAAFESVGGIVNVTYGNLTSPLAWAGPFTTLQYIGSGTAALPMQVCCFMMNQFAKAPDNFFVNLLNCINNNVGLASSGDIIASTSSSTLTISGLKAGSEVRVYRSSDLEELTGIESSETSFSWGFSVTGSVTVEIAILHLEYQYMRLYDIVLSSSDVTIPVQQVKDRNYDNPIL